MQIQLILSLVTGFFALGIHNQQAGSHENGELTVSVTDLKNNAGQIGILLFDQKGGFPDSRDKAVRQILLPIEGSEMQHTFADLPFGVYAVTVMHDENGNKKLDKNIFGIPTEGNGVSNNIRNRMGPPKFKQAVFKMDRPSYSIGIKMRY